MTGLSPVACFMADGRVKATIRKTEKIAIRCLPCFWSNRYMDVGCSLSRRNGANTRFAPSYIRLPIEFGCVLQLRRLAVGFQAIQTRLGVGGGGVGGVLGQE